jgi:hypothetical protein
LINRFESISSAGEQEKLNLLAPLIRGFGLPGFVVVARSRNFAVCLSSVTIFFDIEAVSFMHTDTVLYANWHPTNAQVEWDIKTNDVERMKCTTSD